MLKSFYTTEPDAVVAQLLDYGHPKYRAYQLLKWVYEKHVYNPEEMSDLPKQFRDEIWKTFDFKLPKIISHATSQDGSIKYVIKLKDNHLIETVMIPSSKKRTLCISSQVGCPHRCHFCATGKGGFQRNLTALEIISQFLLVARENHKEKITNLVFMGMGEPLDNLEAVLQVLRILQAERGISFSPRRTTISTCGIVPKIKLLADSGVKTKLAVSLNAAMDSKRSQIMLMNKTYPLQELKLALKYFRAKTSYRITLEYIMIPELNMTLSDAKALMTYARDLSCKVNLIPLNPIDGFAYRSPNAEEVSKFLALLMPLQKSVTVRKSAGADIFGACGQLASQRSKNE